MFTKAVENWIVSFLLHAVNVIINVGGVLYK